MSKPGTKTRFSIGIICCLSVFQLLAQATLSADSNYVETGNAFQLHLQFPSHLGKPADTLKFGAWADIIPQENILEQSDWITVENGYYSKTLTVLFFDEDSLQLPPLRIALRNGDTLQTNALDLVVKATPAPEDLNDMAPVKDIHREPTDWTDYLPWALGILAIIALLWLFYYLAMRRQKARLLSRSVALPPHELAFKKLEALKQKNRIATGQIKEHYAELTHILREYLEKRFNVPALESTTYETIQDLQKSDFPPHLIAPLLQLLEQADLAKFARIIPEASFHDSSFNLAHQLVEETMPVYSENSET
ncbi:MAG: hypothetical protein JNN28_13845 [Saprospiraceae bacterium]|nr:hypothetical protein [Saprospiraceae bacterium]